MSKRFVEMNVLLFILLSGVCICGHVSHIMNGKIYLKQKADIVQLLAKQHEKKSLVLAQCLPDPSQTEEITTKQ